MRRENRNEIRLQIFAVKDIIALFKLMLETAYEDLTENSTSLGTAANNIDIGVADYVGATHANGCAVY